MAFSLTQQDTLFVLLSYVIIIPAYRLVLSKVIGIYKIGAYLFVYQEGNIFNWERRSNEFYDREPKVFRKKMQAFNFPFLFTSTFVTGMFLVRTNWKVTCQSSYEVTKGILAMALYAYIICMILKNRSIDVRKFLPTWEAIKRREELSKAATERL